MTEVLSDFFDLHDASETDVANWARAQGLLEDGSGMDLPGMVQVFNHYDVPAHIETGTWESVDTYLSEGKAVILAVDPSKYWGDGNPPGGHAVRIVDVDLDRGVAILSDSGTPDGKGLEVPLSELDAGWEVKAHQMIVTDVTDTDAAGNDTSHGTGRRRCAAVRHDHAADRGGRGAHGRHAPDRAGGRRGARGQPGRRGAAADRDDGRRLGGAAPGAPASGMTLGPATAAVAEASRTFARRNSGPHAAMVSAIATRVDGPLTVAVIGRLKTGKSTLVNALLARDVAPTAASECTRLVTRFVGDNTEYVKVVMRDGDVVERPLVDKRAPATIEGIDAASVARLDVHLVSRPLTNIEIVDTPGLESLRDENSQETTAFLDPDSEDACAGADAIVYCMTDMARASDLTTLYGTSTTMGDPRALGTIAVLNRADQITGGWEGATKQAGVIAEILRGLAAAVVPLSALPAAAVRCGLVDAELQRAVSELAGLSEEERQVLMLDSGLFISQPAGTVSPEVRERLLTTTSFGGAVAAVNHLVCVPGDRAGATRAIDEASHFGDLETKIFRLQSRDDALESPEHARRARADRRVSHHLVRYGARSPRSGRRPPHVERARRAQAAGGHGPGPPRPEPPHR